MKQITQEYANSANLIGTHEVFWPAQITKETELAFRISTRNKMNAFITPWVPKSKLMYVLVEVTQKEVFEPSTGNFIPNPELGTMRKKYYVPKFFIK